MHSTGAAREKSATPPMPPTGVPPSTHSENTNESRATGARFVSVGLRVDKTWRFSVETTTALTQN